MAMILDAFMSKCCTLLTDFVEEEVITVLGVKAELQKLQRRLASIQRLLRDAEKKKFEDSSIDHWLYELKDVMYDADDLIDLCKIEGAQLLAVQTPKASPSCCNLSSALSCFKAIPLRHEIGNRIKELNDRLSQIYEDRKQFKLEQVGKSESHITMVDSRQTSSMADVADVGRETEKTANELAERLIAEKVDERCRLFAITGMGGIGKTTLAQKIFNHPKIQGYFNLKVWTCVSQTYLETELLQQVIRSANGSYGHANTKSELLPILKDAIIYGHNLFLVLDDVWRADVWTELLRAPVQNANTSVRILVTTRYEKVARDMEAALIHPVMNLSIESGWDMLKKRLFTEGQEELASSLRELGLLIADRCGGLPLAIKVIAGVLSRRERSKKEWEKVLLNDAWSISKSLPEELRGALYLSYEDLPSHLKQCFLFCSLFPEDANLDRRELVRFWVALGFVEDQKEKLMEDLAEDYFNELLRRNLLLPELFNELGDSGKMHDFTRSLALFLSKEESYCRDSNLKNATKFTKFRHLSVAYEWQAAAKILDSVSEQEALRTLLAPGSNLILDDERLRSLSHLRVLQLTHTPIQAIPDSIGNLVHLRFLDFDGTRITSIPESIQRLVNLQFLNIRACKYLKELPIGITRLRNLRRLGLYNTPLDFFPKGICKLQQLNDLSGFVVSSNESSSKLEELNSLKQIRMLSICKLEKAQSGSIILRELPLLNDLKLYFTNLEEENINPSLEAQESAEKLFDELIPPRNLEELKVKGFFGRRFPNWMQILHFEECVPYLTILVLGDIPCCHQLPPLGQLSELKLLSIKNMTQVKKIGVEFLGRSSGIAFPKLEVLRIEDMPELEEWSLGTELEQIKVLPCLQELIISDCPALKELPKGLKYSGMRSLIIDEAESMKSLGDLSKETETLEVIDNECLEKIFDVPSLKRLVVRYCSALRSVEKLGSLKELVFFDEDKERLPEWLLGLLQQWTLKECVKDDDFLLQLECSQKALRECLKGGSHWEILQHIPRVIAYESLFGKGYLRYNKQPYVYDTNVLTE